MDSRAERVKNFSKIFSKSRYDAHKSQEWIAAELGVSRQSVANWESGASSPSFFQSTEWFRALGLNPMPYYLEFLFPAEEFDSNEELLIQCVKSLPEETKEQLLFLLLGKHGSSPISVMQMLTANLHTPMHGRVTVARTIIDNYEISKHRGELICPDDIQPNMDNLYLATEMGKDAAKNGGNGYATN